MPHRTRVTVGHIFPMVDVGPCIRDRRPYHTHRMSPCMQHVAACGSMWLLHVGLYIYGSSLATPPHTHTHTPAQYSPVHVLLS